MSFIGHNHSLPPAGRTPAPVREIEMRCCMAQKDFSFTAYDNAICFANAFRLLNSKSNILALMQSHSASDASLAMPTIVNGAFACELFLKALLKEPPRSGKEAHSLVSLLNQYDLEQPGKRERIMQACIQVMNNAHRDDKYDEAAFQRDLQVMDTAFMNVRYWHEPKKPGFDQTYNLGFLIVLIEVLQLECSKAHGKSVFQS